MGRWWRVAQLRSDRAGGLSGGSSGELCVAEEEVVASEKGQGQREENLKVMTFFALVIDDGSTGQLRAGRDFKAA